MGITMDDIDKIREHASTINNCLGQHLDNLKLYKHKISSETHEMLETMLLEIQFFCQSHEDIENVKKNQMKWDIMFAKLKLYGELYDMHIAPLTAEK